VASMLEGVITVDIFLQAIGLSVGLGAISGLYPAWRASRLTPAEAMRAATSAATPPRRLAAIGRLLGSAALRNLWRRPTRTVVTLSGIGLGVGFTVALMGMALGVEATFTNLMGAGESDLLAEEKGVADASLSVIAERTADRIRAHPQVKSVSKMVFGLTTAPGLPFFMVYGLDPREAKINDYRIREGRRMEREGEIILGRLAANSLEKTVGEKIRVSGMRLTIVGIYENGSAFEDTGATMLLRDAQRLFDKPREVSFLGIAVHDRERADEIARLLEQQFPDLMISTTTTFTERMQDFRNMEMVLDMLIGLTMLVGGIVMMNAMLMSVFERTQEIGVLRALGWRRRRVVRMVLIEALGLSLLSGVAGVGIGVGLNRLLGLIPYFGALLEPIYTGTMFAKIGVLVLVLGVLGGIYPAWRAAGLRPIEALRYE